MATFEPRWKARNESPEGQAERLAAARQRGNERAASEPCATEVAFDQMTGRFSLTLQGGASFAFPAASLSELAGATNAQLAEVTLTPSGSGLRWEALDADVSVPGLILSFFGGPEWQRALRQAANRMAARTRSAARTLASQENGKKGGRPRKTAP